MKTNHKSFIAPYISSPTTDRYGDDEKEMETLAVPKNVMNKQQKLQNKK